MTTKQTAQCRVRRILKAAPIGRVPSSLEVLPVCYRLTGTEARTVMMALNLPGRIYYPAQATVYLPVQRVRDGILAELRRAATNSTEKGKQQ